LILKVRKIQVLLVLVLILLTLFSYTRANEDVDVNKYYSLHQESSPESHNPINLYLEVDSQISEVTLVYYSLSNIPEEYIVTQNVSESSVLFTIPKEHTGEPGIEYHLIFYTKDGLQLKTQTYSVPFIITYNQNDSEISILSGTKTQYWWDIGFKAGLTSDGLDLSSRRSTAKLPFRNSSPPVTSKSMEIRNISGSYFHRGIDFGASTGTPVYNIFDNAKVYNIVHGTTGYGKYVQIEYARKSHIYTVIYAHLDSINSNLSIGQTIDSNTLIGTVGSTGDSTGPHLHLEFSYYDGHRKNLYPAAYFFMATSSYDNLRGLDLISTPYRNESYGETSVRVHAYSANNPSADYAYIVFRRKGTSTWTTASMTKINSTYHLWEYKFSPSLDGSTVEYYILFRKTFNGIHRYVTRPAYFAYEDTLDHPNPYGKYYECYVGATQPNSQDI
jgi:murein DD-endopeptidase MepM/ murein hydrolase activator NlpD